MPYKNSVAHSIFKGAPGRKPHHPPSRKKPWYEVVWDDFWNIDGNLPGFGNPSHLKEGISDVPEAVDDLNKGITDTLKLPGRIINFVEDTWPVLLIGGGAVLVLYLKK